MAHKDIFCTTSGPTTCGSKMLKNYQATYNATVVNKCEEAGLISIGKLNMDEFAMGSTNENSAFGAVKILGTTSTAQEALLVDRQQL